jgi:hypothetical protein
MKNSKWLNNIARLIRRKDGKYFLKFERAQDKNKQYIGDSPFPLVINEGDVFQARLKKDDLQSLVDSGRMSQEVADRICETVKFEFSKAPDREAPKPSGQSEEDDGVNF